MDERPSETVVAAWTALVRAEQFVLKAVEADLKAAGFPPLGWYDVLLELRRAHPERLRPQDLEQRLLLAQYNVSRLVDRLAQAGYLVKASCPVDRRGQMLAITAAGRALLTRMWPIYAAAIQRHLGAKLGDAEARQLARLLRKLLA